MNQHIAVLEQMLRDDNEKYVELSAEEHSAITAAIALMREREGLSGKVRDAKFGLAMIEVDCAYFGPHMIGPGDSVRIFVEQKAAPTTTGEEQG